LTAGAFSINNLKKLVPIFQSKAAELRDLMQHGLAADGNVKSGVLEGEKNAPSFRAS